MLNETHFLEAGFWRFLFAVVPLFLLAYNGLPSWQTVRENIVGISLVGVISLFGFNFFFFLGMMNSPAINGALIISITPILTILLSRFMLKTPLKRNQIIGAVLSLFGVMFLIMKGKLANVLHLGFSVSDLFLLAASMFFALQNVWVKKYAGAMSNKNFTFLTNLFCFICFVLVLPFSGIEASPSLSFSYWGAAIGIGFLGTSVAYYLWNLGIQLTSPNYASIFGNLIPLSTAVFSILLGEQLYSYHFISGGIIILGVIVLGTKRLEGSSA